MKNLRKDAILGIILLGLYLVIKYLFRGGGLFLWLLGAVGLVVLVVGLLPEDLHKKVMDFKQRLFNKGK
ncbi:MAG: hypothetical protein GX611_01615 [Clostridiales bacterium]|jgi:hypothetical protein|nr:hypothetical protein [Clostridiales bacterium]